MCWMSAQTTAINVLSLLWARTGLVPHDKGAWIPSGNSALGTLQRVLSAIGLQGSYFFAIKTTPGQEFERFFLASSPGFTDLEYLHNAILEYLRSSWTTLEFSYRYSMIFLEFDCHRLPVGAPRSRSCNPRSPPERGRSSPSELRCLMEAMGWFITINNTLW